MSRVICVILAMSVLPACSSFFRDRSMAYVDAKTTPPLNIPSDVSTRPITPLYPIPEMAAKPINAPAEAPFPPEMKAQVGVELAALPSAPGRTPVKFGTDGNGVPELRVVGPRERVWDELGRTLKAIDVKIKDRNQSLGIVYITVGEQDYQLRMIRATEAYVISVQRDDDTLAPVSLSRNLLGTLQVRWL
ncbi:MAG: outer membrane protein assembly factor BamC [Paraperlucidibaca sp.]